MFLLKTVEPGQATGSVAKIYSATHRQARVLTRLLSGDPP